MEIFSANSLEKYQEIEKDSIDLMLIDPPYGNIKGLNFGTWDLDTTEWDDSIPPKIIFDIADYLLNYNGRLIVFSQETYTSDLISEYHKSIKFNYKNIWYKNRISNCLLVNKSTAKYTEDILVFTKKYDSNKNNPLRDYSKKILEFINEERTEIIEEVESGNLSHFLHSNGLQFRIPTKNSYKELSKKYELTDMEYYKSYEELEKISNEYKEEPTFNIPAEKNHIKNVFEYEKVTKCQHPTQKPVPLLKKLIEIYSNEGDTISDLFMGSGSTGVAAKETNRDFIGIEKKEEYYRIAEERISE